MMVKKKTELTWNEVDPSTLQSDAKEAYDSFLQIQAKATAARHKFEKLCAKAAGLPSSKRFVFSYKFQRLSVAIADAKTNNVGRNAIDFDSVKAAAKREG
jgi:hypothetical protein